MIQTEIEKESGTHFFLTQQLLGTRITDILLSVDYDESNELDIAECYVVLDNMITIEMPNNSFGKVWVSDLIENTPPSIFSDLSDYPIYNLNEIRHLKETNNDFAKEIENHFLEKTPLSKKYEHVITYHERTTKYLKDKAITDFIVLKNNHSDSGFIQTDNGYIFGVTWCGPPEMGITVLRVYSSIDEFRKRYGQDYLLLTSNR